MIKILICDDDFLFAKKVESVINSFFLCKCSVVIDISLPEKIEKKIDNHDFEYDIALLSLDNKENKNGITYGGMINDLHPHCQIIYMSSNNKFIDQAYETFHIYFIWKDKLSESMPKALNKAYKVIGKYNAKYLICNTQHKLVKVYMEDIYYIERERHTTNIYTREKCYKVKETLNKLSQTLSVYVPLIRCHISYYVNLEHIISYKSSEFVLSSNTIIPISRKYNKEVKEIILSATFPL